VLEFGQVALRNSQIILQLEKREKQLQKFGGSSDFIIQPHLIHSLMKKAISFMVPFVCLKKKAMSQRDKYITPLAPPRKLGEVNLSK
jgi:hypothetical protein